MESAKEVKRIRPIIDKINSLEEEISKLTDEELLTKFALNNEEDSLVRKAAINNPNLQNQETETPTSLKLPLFAQKSRENLLFFFYHNKKLQNPLQLINNSTINKKVQDLSEYIYSIY